MGGWVEEDHIHGKEHFWIETGGTICLPHKTTCYYDSDEKSTFRLCDDNEAISWTAEKLPSAGEDHEMQVKQDYELFLSNYYFGGQEWNFTLKEVLYHVAMESVK